MKYAFLLVLTPSLCFAQQRIGGFKGRTPGIKRESALDVPKLVNPVNLLIIHRQELTLSDSQWKNLLSMKRALDSTNAPLMRRLDSVQSLFKGGMLFGDQSREHRDSLAEARLTVKQTTADLEDNYGTARDRAFALLDALQSSRATDLIDKAEKEIADEEDKARRNSGRGGPPG
jgi:hypothetical protein